MLLSHLIAHIDAQFLHFTTSLQLPRTPFLPLTCHALSVHSLVQDAELVGEFLQCLKILQVLHTRLHTLTCLLDEKQWEMTNAVLIHRKILGRYISRLLDLFLTEVSVNTPHTISHLFLVY